VSYGGIVPFIKLFRHLKLLLKLRRKHFDLAINMRTLVTRSGARKIRLLLNIINARKTAGRDTDGRGSFLDTRIPETFPGKKYEMEYDIDTVNALGAEVKDKNIDFNIDEESINKVDKVLEKEGVSEDDTLIGIHLGGMPSRRWPIDNFSKVIDDINKRISCKFVITGGVDEINAKIIDLVGKLTIRELGALIKECNLFITNDTGPMHVAAILRIPLVAIFGPGDITRFDPRNISDKAIVLYKKVDCAPCEKVECEDLKCLKIILPEEVKEAIGKLLNI